MADFAATYGPYAQKAAALTGLPVELILAQWKIESASGTSYGTKHRNNLAGIGGLGNYRVYKTLDDFAVDYANFIKRKYPQVIQAAKTGGAQAAAVALGNSNWAEHKYRKGATGKEGQYAGIPGTEGYSLLAAMGGQTGGTVAPTRTVPLTGRGGQGSAPVAGPVTAQVPVAQSGPTANGGYYVPVDVSIPTLTWEQVQQLLGDGPKGSIDQAELTKLALALADAPVEFPDPQKAYDDLLRLSKQRIADLQAQTDANLATATGQAGDVTAAIKSAASGLGADAALAGLGDSANAYLKLAAQAATNKNKANEADVLARGAAELWNTDLRNRGQLAADTPKNRIDALKTYFDIAKANQDTDSKTFEQRAATLRSWLTDSGQTARTTATINNANARGNQSMDRTILQGQMATERIVLQDTLKRTAAIQDAQWKLYTQYVNGGMDPATAKKFSEKAAPSIGAAEFAASSFKPVNEQYTETQLVDGTTLGPSELVKQLAFNTFFNPTGDPYSQSAAIAIMSQYATNAANAKAVPGNPNGKTEKERKGSFPVDKAELLRTMVKEYNQYIGDGLDGGSREQIRQIWLKAGAASVASGITPVTQAASASSGRSGVPTSASWLGVGAAGAAGLGSLVAGPPVVGQAMGVALLGGAVRQATVNMLNKWFPNVGKRNGPGGQATPQAINTLIKTLLDPQKSATFYAYLSNGGNLAALQEQAKLYPQLGAALTVGQYLNAASTPAFSGSAPTQASLDQSLAVLQQIYG